MPTDRALRQPVPVMALICSPEHVVQFADQVMHFGSCFDHSFDRDAHRGQRKVQPTPELSTGFRIGTNSYGGEFREVLEPDLWRS